jgi:hypothetical protein
MSDCFDFYKCLIAPGYTYIISVCVGVALGYLIITLRK